MRKEHELERQFKKWRGMAYHGVSMHPSQEKGLETAFMGGSLVTLTFVVEQLTKSEDGIRQSFDDLFSFLKVFHENRVREYEENL